VDRRENLPTTSWLQEHRKLLLSGAATGRWPPVDLSQIRAFGQNANKPAPFGVIGKLVIASRFQVCPADWCSSESSGFELRRGEGVGRPP
jgi:hypothetical protein